MATLYRNVNGRQLEKYLAILPGVQYELDSQCIDIGARAEHNLQQAEVRTGEAHIELLNGGNKNRDRYVVLVDSNVTNAESLQSNSALSIEFGREAYVDENGVEHGGMNGLAVLTNAAHLPKKAHAKSKKPKIRSRPKRGDRGRFA